MKKIAIFILLAVMIFALAACGLIDINKPDNGDDNTDNNDNKTEVVLTFDTGSGAFADGKTSVNVTADDNGKVTMTNEPRRDGYAFNGWYNGDKKFDPSAKYTTGQTFTASYVSGADNNVYEKLFDEASTVSIDINMSDAEWKKLNQDHIDFQNKGGKSPIYRMANSVTISIDGLRYYFEEVGVRMKGNTSRHQFYNDNGFFDNVHLKLSFKQTFDDEEDGYKPEELKVWTDKNKRDERKARTLGGMEKIDIKYNSTFDDTYVREMYAMKMFRDNGILAPYITLCSLTALEKDTTSRNLGVYRIHEPIDEAFIERRLHENKVGDLWKCTYSVKGPADLTNYDLDNRVGVEDELKGQFYSYDKKTNKKKDKTTGLRDLSSIKNLIVALNESNANYEQLIDVDYFVKFEAINYILGNPDCIRNNYNNYYLYFRADGKAIIIPYDYDRCLGLTSWNPTGSANMNIEPYTRSVAATGGQQYNPLYKNLIDKGAPTGEGSALMRYRLNLIAMSKSQGFTAAAFNAYKDNYKAKYAQYTATAISKNCIAFDATNMGNVHNVSFAEYITTKLQTLNNNIDNYNP